QDCREAVATGEGVGDFVLRVEAERAIIDDRASIAEEARVSGVGAANAERTGLVAQLDEALVQERSVRLGEGVVLEASLNVRTERAPLGLVASVNAQLEAGERRVLVARTVVVLVTLLVTDVAANAQAGLGARNVEEANAVGVADADEFHRLWLCDDDRVSSAGAGRSNNCYCGAEKEALDVHF